MHVGGGRVGHGASVLGGGVMVVGGGTLEHKGGTGHVHGVADGDGVSIGGGAGRWNTTAPMASVTAKNPPTALETTSEQGLAPAKYVLEE